MLIMAVIGIILIVFFLIGLNIYNGLISLKNQLQRAWANIDVILKQRFDEVPQLVQIIEQYANYEAGLLQKLADARSNYGGAKSIDDKIKSSQEMSLALSGIAAIGESYPELKANQNFMNLQTRISGLESTLSDRREIYNEVVSNFNTRLEQFPDVIAARILGYNPQNLFQVSEVERQAPQLKMNLPKFGS